MINEGNKFEMLIEEICATLSLSYNTLKEKYKDYPICLMEYHEKEKNKRAIEVRHDDQLSTITLFFDDENNCYGIFLFFDHTNDEDLFIEYLNKDTEYDFKRSCWKMIDCYLKVKPSKWETAFYFYK